ncbi:hypothetical protein H9Q69_008701 [Fusarium xylarioides]|nr:hypothetical protein H9Q70_011356 [Fusarium xylarioides]KAG5774868.1 hypothetical protein H9Q73_011445 [Fusarium xylarioides]KAG5792237.1 hypothetical protein H9Q69_008701 [Fusarium xylarioides]KAG5804503.1 hypothetical protein H9Q71_010927 [Fusarium xylarioides]KAG5816844.1 hypothetical protein H9Q74_010879 [Fusarium xylarioides]
MEPSQRRRAGCTECKRKKAKCDEKRPSCSRCYKYPHLCSYELSVKSFRVAKRKPAKDAQRAHQGSVSPSPFRPALHSGLILGGSTFSTL